MTDIPQFEVAALDLSPDDVVVFRTPARMTRKQRERLGDVGRRLFPNNPCVILDPGFSIEIVKGVDAA